MSDNIINTFQQRRQLALDVAEMANADSQYLLQAAAAAIVEQYDASMVQAEVLKNLETPDSRMRGGLGQLVSLLPTEEIAPALRSVAADRRQPAQSRITAVNLLSQFTDESVPQALINDLNNGNDVALQSLREAVEEGNKNRLVLLDYVQQMRQAGDYIAPMVLDMLDRIPGADRVELLRLIALDDREYVAKDALVRLEKLAQDRERNDALRALYTLRFLLPPELVNTAVDALRRLQFSGRSYQAPEPTQWRALITFPGLNGWQSIWFVHPPSVNEVASAEENEAEDDGIIFIVNINTFNGAIKATGNEHQPAYEIPQEWPVGTVVPRESGEVARPQYLEAPFDYGRWLVLETLPLHWKLEEKLSPEVRLFGDLLYSYPRPVPPEDVYALLRDPPKDSSVGIEELVEEVQQGAVYQRWLENNANVLTLGPIDDIPQDDESQQLLVQTILSQLEEQPFGVELAKSMNHSLRMQAAWFKLAGDEEAAQLARTFADTLPETTLSDNPLLFDIILAGIRDQNAAD